MDSKHIGLTVIYAGPVVASIISLIIVGLYRGKTTDNDRRILFNILSGFFACIAINWIFIILYIFNTALYTRMNILCYATFLLTQVVLYHYIYVITRVPGKKPFPKWHYYLVGMIVLAFGIWSVFVPFEAKHYIVFSRGDAAPGYALYSRFFTLRIPLKAIYSVVYAFLSWKLLLNYRRAVVHYSADTGRASLGWAYVLLGLTLTLTFIPVFGTIAGQARSVSTFVPGLAMIPIVIQLVILCYFTITGSYVIIENSPGQDRSDIIEDRETDTAPGLSEIKSAEQREFLSKFEQMIETQKPYLDSQLRITDLAEVMHTNRSYLSAFINRTYGMNFSRYINRLRIKEMEALAKSPEHVKSSITDLALASGFSSYRSYHKFRHTEESSFERPVMN